MGAVVTVVSFRSSGGSLVSAASVTGCVSWRLCEMIRSSASVAVSGNILPSGHLSAGVPSGLDVSLYVAAHD